MNKFHIKEKTFENNSFSLPMFLEVKSDKVNDYFPNPLKTLF